MRAILLSATGASAILQSYIAVGRCFRRRNGFSREAASRFLRTRVHATLRHKSRDGTVQRLSSVHAELSDCWGTFGSINHERDTVGRCWIDLPELALSDDRAGNRRTGNV